jgi:hypothetical protein
MGCSINSDNLEETEEECEKSDNINFENDIISMEEDEYSENKIMSYDKSNNCELPMIYNIQNELNNQENECVPQIKNSIGFFEVNDQNQIIDLENLNNFNFIGFEKNLNIKYDNIENENNFPTKQSIQITNINNLKMNSADNIFKTQKRKKRLPDNDPKRFEDI